MDAHKAAAALLVLNSLRLLIFCADQMLNTDFRALKLVK